MLAYPVDITPDGDALLVRFPDVPEAITFGDSQADALTRARDALETALIAYVEARQPLPEPSVKPGSHVISVSALSEIEEAFRALHRKLTIQVVDAA